MSDDFFQDFTRESRGIETLVSMLAPGSGVPSDVVQCTMSLLGNLLTDVFDSRARDSLALFVGAGGLQRCLDLVDAEYPINLYASAALQNVTALDPEEEQDIQPS